MDDTVRPHLRIVLVEDSPQDAELVRRALVRAGLPCEAWRVDTIGALLAALTQHAPDVVLADYSMPHLDGKAVVRLVRERFPHIPVIMVTGTLGDEGATELLKMGARDYVLKDRLARLGPAVQRALAEERGIRARKAAELAVRESEVKFRRLFEASRDAIMIREEGSDVIVDVNSAMEGLVGYPRQALIGKRPAEIDALKTLICDWVRGAADIETTCAERQIRSTSGRVLDVEMRCSRYRAGEARLVQCNLRDITERRRAETALAESEVRFRALIENASDIIAVVDAKGIVQYVSPAVQVQGGYDPAEIVGRNFMELVHIDDNLSLQQRFQALIASPGAYARTEQRYRDKTGSWHFVETISRNLLDTPPIHGIVVNMRDVTDRRLAEEELRRSRASLAEAQRIARLGNWTLDVATQDIAWSEESYRILGVDAATFKPTCASVMARIHPGDRPAAETAVQRLLGHGEPMSFEHRIVLDDGVRWVHERAIATFGTDGKPRKLVGTVQDVTERRLAQDALRETAARVEKQLGAVGVASAAEAQSAGDIGKLARELTEVASRTLDAGCVSIWLFSQDGTRLDLVDVFAAASGEHETGQTMDQATFRDAFEAMRHARYIDAADAENDPRTRGYTEKYLRPLGVGALLDVLIEVDGRKLGLLKIAHVGGPRAWRRDEIAFACQLADKVGFALTTRERRHMEEQLRRSNRALRTLSAGNTALVYGTDESELFRQMCHIAVELGGYGMAWVGLAQASEPLVVVAQAARAGNQGSSSIAALSAEDGPVVQALRLGSVQSGRVAERQFMAFPLKHGAEAFGVLVIYQGDEALAADEQPVLQQLAADLAYGVTMLRSRAAHERSEQQLRETMEATVYAVAGTVERRDLYTAGHQRRVAVLAMAIGQELGLGEDRLRGVHLAATIHDVGKIIVPAEILTKPGRLTPLEYEMVKQHPQTGYDIVKDVRFPWPIAEMVRQHHERMDGSGYPRGLKGEAILLEARIIGVADIVEAIASHRPYRPSLGLDVALAELEKGRGTRYDAQVVDACLRLFREKGYSLPV